MKEIYVYDFKMIYFKKMLLAGFGNNNEIRSIVSADHSGFAEIILTMQDYQFIDSIVAVDKAKIIADSAASIGRRAEGAEGKRVFDRVLSRYASKWLNDVAKERSHAYINSRKQY
jgi:DNA primase